MLTPKILDIKCPCNNNCDLKFDENLINILLSNQPELYEKFNKFKKLHSYNQESNGMWCIKPGCENFIRRIDEKGSKITCDKCKYKMCFLCKNIWHGRRSCEESLDKQLLIYKKKFPVKKCPKCKSDIEKNSGCNHMTCSRCNYQFCWICLKVYTFDHYDLNNVFGCPGLQYIDNPDIKIFLQLFWGRMRVYLFIFFLVILSPLLVAFGAFAFPIYGMNRSGILDRASKKKKILTYSLCLLISLLLFPIIVILEIFPGSYLLYKEIKIYGFQ